MKKAAIVLLLLIGSAMATKYAAEFTDLGVGVRAAGMGGAFTSFDGDPQTIWWNPAGLQNLSEKLRFYYMHATMFDNLYSVDAGAAARKLGESYLGIGFFRNGTENIPFTNDDGYYDYGIDRIPGTGDFGEGNGQWDPGERIDPDAVLYSNEGDYLFTAAISHRFGERLALGVSIKHLQSYIGEYSAFGFGADIGATYNLSERVVLGATMRDAVGTHIRWSTGLWEHKSPSLWLGGKYSIPLSGIRGGLNLTADLENRFENYDAAVNLGEVSIDPHIGAELTVLKHIFLRLGLDRTDISAGAGLALGFFRVDYAFVDNSALDVTHRIGVNFEIPEVHIKLPKRKKPIVSEVEEKITPAKEEVPVYSAALPDEPPVGERLADVKFPFSSIDLTDETKAQLDSVCAIWQKFRTHRIYIEGHTDNVRIDTPEFPDNYALSKTRAEAAAEYLRTSCSIPANRIITAWFGPDHPKSTNSTAEGRSINRRVEIFLWEP